MGLAFSPDGTKMFVISSNFDSVIKYDLTTAFDVTSGDITTATSFSVKDQDERPNGLTFSPDGTKMFVTGYGSGGRCDTSIPYLFPLM